MLESFFNWLGLYLVPVQITLEIIRFVLKIAVWVIRQILRIVPFIGG